jgi:hypothetical protein
LDKSRQLSHFKEITLTVFFFNGIQILRGWWQQASSSAIMNQPSSFELRLKPMMN